MGVVAKAVAWLGQRLLNKEGKDSIIGTIIDRRVTDKNLATELKGEIEKAIEEHSHEFEMKFIEVVQEAQIVHEWEPKFSQILKGSTRWIIALMMTIFYIYLRISSGTVTEYDQYLIGGIWGFLFILRSVEKVTGKTK